MSNYATKSDLKNATNIDTSDFFDLTISKLDVDELGIDKFKNVPSGLGSLESKVDKLDIDKVKPVLVDLKKIECSSR